MMEIPQDIIHELARQEEKWGTQNLPDDRWMEVAEDEYKDLRWAVRTRAEVPNHTIQKERAQLISVLIRWHAQGVRNE